MIYYSGHTADYGCNDIKHNKGEFSDCGYDVYSQLVNAKDFGVPQDRERVIIVGFKKDLNIKPFEIPIPANMRMTMRKALVGMPEPTEDEVCNQPYSSRYMSRNRKRSSQTISLCPPLEYILSFTPLRINKALKHLLITSFQ